MKLYIIRNAILGVLTGGILLSSCSKKLDEAYENPNAPKRVPVEQLFPSMIGSVTGSSSAAGSAYGLCGDGIIIGRYIQSWGGYTATTTSNGATQYDRMGGITDVSDNGGSMWAAHYYGMGQNLNKIIEWGTEEKKWDYVGAAWALRAWSMFEASNEYGLLILRQAFDIHRQQFTYEDQSEVYDSVRVICNRAIEFLNMTGGGMNAANFANSDFYFNNGDLGRWKKFVYGILARSYAYLTAKSAYITNSYADSVIKYASLSCASNADNITCKFQGTAISGTNNYFGTFRSNVNGTSTNPTIGIRQSAFIANLMSGATGTAFAGVSDPRRWYLLRENANSTFKGYSASYSSTINPTLITADQPFNFVGTGFGSGGTYLNPEGGRYIFRDAAPFPIMTASEMFFLIAEAALRKSDNVTARNAYINAISLNFDMLSNSYGSNVPTPITAGSKAAYLADPLVVPASPGGMTLTKIMLQKYIALYGWGIQETWTDMRRYHYTDADPATLAQVYYGWIAPSGGNLYSGNLGGNNGKFVYRIRPRYNSEYLYNIPSLLGVGAYPVNNDYHTNQCWFSKQ